MKKDGTKAGVILFSDKLVLTDPKVLKSAKKDQASGKHDLPLMYCQIIDTEPRTKGCLALSCFTRPSLLDHKVSFIVESMIGKSSKVYVILVSTSSFSSVIELSSFAIRLRRKRSG